MTFFSLSACVNRVRNAVALLLRQLFSYILRLFERHLFTRPSVMDAIRNGWFSELSEELWPGQCFSLRVKEILHEEKSDFQDIKIIDT